MKHLFLLSFIAVAAPASAQLSATGSAVPPAEAQSALDFHNKVRDQVGAPPLAWSESLSAYAQKWAEQLAARRCRMEHRPLSGEWAQQYGENIFWGSGRYFDATDASKAWYSEKKDYRYGALSETNFARVAHYTQMVWNATREVGMGAARCRDGSWIIVANYHPRGNYVGEKPY